MPIAFVASLVFEEKSVVDLTTSLTSEIPETVVPSLLSLAPSGRPLLPATEIVKGYLTLVDKEKNEYNKDLPLELFLRNDAITHIKPKLISIRNCYVNLPLIGTVVIPVGPPAGYGLVFVFFYDPYDPNKHRINSIGEVEEVEEAY